MIMKLILILLTAITFIVAILTSYWFGKAVGINTCIDYINYKYNSSNNNKILGVLKNVLKAFNAFDKKSNNKIIFYSILLFISGIMVLVIFFII